MAICLRKSIVLCQGRFGDSDLNGGSTNRQPKAPSALGMKLRGRMHCGHHAEFSQLQKLGMSLGEALKRARGSPKQELHCPSQISNCNGIDGLTIKEGRRDRTGPIARRSRVYASQFVSAGGGCRGSTEPGTFRTDAVKCQAGGAWGP